MASSSTVVVLQDVGPVNTTITMARVNTFPIGFILEDANGPIDFTGDSFVLVVNPAADGSGVDLFSVANSNTLDATGLVEFQPSLVNMTVAAGNYFHGIQWTTAGGDVRLVMAGAFTICENIPAP